MGPLAGVLHLVGGRRGRGVQARRHRRLLRRARRGRRGRGSWPAGQHHVIRGTSPRAPRAAARQLIGKPIRAGTKLPSNVAIANVTVELQPPTRKIKRAATVHCPPGMVNEGLAMPRTERGLDATGKLRMYQLSDRDVDRMYAVGHGYRSAVIDYAAKPRKRPIVISVGTMCKRR